MGYSYASAIVAADPSDVWSVVRAFDDLPRWHSAIATSAIEGGGPAVPGCVRKLELSAGGSVRERFTACDDTELRCGYEMLDGPFPLRTYHARIRVAPVTETAASFVEWSARFDADAADEPGLQRTFTEDVFAVGLRDLQQLFST